MRLVPLIAAVSLVVGTSAPAVADSWSAKDKSRDVTSTHYSPDPPPCGTFTRAKVPRDKKTDIVGLAVEHNQEQVVVQFSLRTLTAHQKFGAEINLRTSGRDFELHANRYAPEGWPDVTLSNEFDPGDGAGGECGTVAIVVQPLDCEGLSLSHDAMADVVTIAVPRSCIGAPDWVKVGLATYRFKGQTSFHDHWGRKKDIPKDNSWVNPLSPRIHVDPAP
jgi:hypothetical protein